MISRATRTITTNGSYNSWDPKVAYDKGCQHQIIEIGGMDHKITSLNGRRVKAQILYPYIFVTPPYPLCPTKSQT